MKPQRRDSEEIQKDRMDEPKLDPSKAQTFNTSSAKFIESYYNEQHRELWLFKESRPHIVSINMVTGETNEITLTCSKLHLFNFDLQRTRLKLIIHERETGLWTTGYLDFNERKVILFDFFKFKKFNLMLLISDFCFTRDRLGVSKEQLTADLFKKIETQTVQSVDFANLGNVLIRINPEPETIQMMRIMELRPQLLGGCFLDRLNVFHNTFQLIDKKRLYLCLFEHKMYSFLIVSAMVIDLSRSNRSRFYRKHIEANDKIMVLDRERVFLRMYNTDEYEVFNDLSGKLMRKSRSPVFAGNDHFQVYYDQPTQCVDSVPSRWVLITGTKLSIMQNTSPFTMLHSFNFGLLPILKVVYIGCHGKFAFLSDGESQGELLVQFRTLQQLILTLDS